MLYYIDGENITEWITTFFPKIVPVKIPLDWPSLVNFPGLQITVKTITL
jgi:hypothetical protein